MIDAIAQELKTLRTESITVVDISEAGVRRHLPAVGASSCSINDDLPLSILPRSSRSGALLGLAGALASAKPHAYVCSVVRTLGLLPGKVKRDALTSQFSQEM